MSHDNTTKLLLKLEVLSAILWHSDAFETAPKCLLHWNLPLYMCSRMGSCKKSDEPICKLVSLFISKKVFFHR